MNSNVQPEDSVTVSCEVCLEQIPLSEAKMEEASDYVLYFCGLDCYKTWREKSNKDAG
jgi:hypothetical protein